MKHWAFVPEKIDGEAVATRVALPVAFSLAGQSPPLLRWRQNDSDKDDGPMAQDSAINLLERPEDQAQKPETRNDLR